MSNSKTNSILIVDDNNNNIRVLFEILHNSGFQVSVVKSGEMALEKVPSIQPDLILLDVMMPGIDGFETCSRLKANDNTKDIPIIFMTALTELENKIKGLQLGAVDYITKPIHVEEVLARVNVHLSLINTKNKLLEEISERREAEAKLQETLTELKQTQTQLIQSEKMSSLGQMVAGIAHEINNPINFIYGNINYVNEYTNNLLTIINIYQQIYPDNHPELAAIAEAIDLNFIIDDLQKLLPSMKVGAERISNIVLSLRNFSRMDEAEFKAVDIHEGIESTLMILQYRLNDKPEQPAIEVIRDYGKLPLVECYAGQLNQVFMNILLNAIDALEANNNQPESQQKKANSQQIKIRTFLDNSQQITIAIADNGLGIPEEVKNRIFDPFFTTKAVGQGTGLGLAISYQIITQKHGGTLECNSTPGEGSEFIIKIPVQQS
ncbi:response regulator [Calothrix sp. FACHB-1219]|uniref:hybrid sensor histidine kinase/response regulator n=1 Tax=unclassified Calothrix TaxID=2619626 RepID=UPI001686C78F|nr:MULTISPECIES: response regulator [unclassified Calothrix]MBD2202191.1 response regulator [Calothrix sp. FACHB-168]MBD2217598.1 response regulator [Calothrix sp. FACHB-1219]